MTGRAQSLATRVAASLINAESCSAVATADVITELHVFQISLLEQ